MKYLLTLGCLCLSLCSLAQAAALDALAQRLQTFAALQARFVQQTYDDSGSLLLTQRGWLALSKPARFYWHTEAPYEQVLLTQTDTAWLYEPDLEQVTVQPLQQALGLTPALLLSGDTQVLAEHFDISQQQQEGLLQFTLVARDNSSPFNQIQLAFAQQTLQQMTFIDALGQRTQVDLSQLQLDPELPEDLFTPNWPEGVDVIGQDQ